MLLVFHKFIWNELMVPLVLPVFDDTSSLGYLCLIIVNHPPVSILEIASCFPTENMEEELKPNTFALPIRLCDSQFFPIFLG